MSKPFYIIHLCIDPESPTLCGLGEADRYREEDYDYEYMEYSHYLHQAEAVSGDYSDDEKCEICWRDLELKLLAHAGED